MLTAHACEERSAKDDMEGKLTSDLRCFFVGGEGGDGMMITTSILLTMGRQS